MLEWDFAQTPPRDRAVLAAKLAGVPFELPCRQGHLRFLNVSKGAFRRAFNLHMKEPDSLRWIDRMAPGSIFWDVGANVGVLSLYAAQRGDLQVHAFEPAAVNYYVLAANCELNGFYDVMNCYLLGFADRTRVGRIEVSQFVSSWPGRRSASRGRPGTSSPAGRRRVSCMQSTISSTASTCPARTT
jgi:FkbM family methyltransferase